MNEKNIKYDENLIKKLYMVLHRYHVRVIVLSIQARMSKFRLKIALFVSFKIALTILMEFCHHFA